MGRTLRLLLLVSASVLAVVVASRVSRTAGIIVGLTAAFLVGMTFFWLPRAAHRAFSRGLYGRAELLYRILRFAVVERHARASVDISMAACALARSAPETALELLGRVDPDTVGEAGRAAWLNNRAYALARSAADLSGALACANEAIALRPRVPGFHHTRGVVLLGLGRLDEAIRELDAVWSQQEESGAPAILEAERCYDLGLAWQRKGERDYARDYFERAHRAAPLSPWGMRAAREVGVAGSGKSDSASLGELL